MQLAQLPQVPALLARMDGTLLVLPLAFNAEPRLLLAPLLLILLANQEIVWEKLEEPILALLAH